jgi:3,4-dihydroxy 2-butanone 4-phosphate synthase/GTP cyclohydrolase II
MTEAPDGDVSSAIKGLNAYAREAARVHPDEPEAHPVHGTTLYLATTRIPTLYGDFTAHIFQDLIHKGYIIALAFGDISGCRELTARLHSSCVTSETLGGCDCDCVQQLEQAMRTIAERGNGVLFYLLQEGRGVGYCAKARDRMLVQASGETLTTFEAYHLLGLKKDYRNYLNIADITKLLGIDADWVLLTNNPDKVAAMEANGLRVARTETLEFEPGPFNQFYLRSKRDSGHILNRTDNEVPAAELPEEVRPFKPYRIPNVASFIHMASYLLPIRAIDNEVVIPMDSVARWTAGQPLDAFVGGSNAPIRRYACLRGNRLAIEFDTDGMQRLQRDRPQHPLPGLCHQPYWFRVHVYFDVVTGDDFVLLTYGQPAAYESPVIRVQSESILNRFPVRGDSNKAKYQLAVQHIVRYGCGAIVLLYQDGRGAGFGAFALDRMLMEQGKTRTTEESYRRMGIPFDQRDYTRVFDVLKTHLPNRNIQMIMNSPNSMVQKSEYAHALNASGLQVVNWIFLESEM